MKKILLSVVFAFLLLFVNAQDSAVQHVQWQYSAVKKDAANYKLVFTATIEKGWRLFSVTMKDDEPNTRIILDSLPAAFVTVNTITEAPTPVTAKEPLLDNATVKYFEETATIEWAVTINKQQPVTGTINYLVYKGNEFAGPEAVPFRFVFDAAGALSSAKGGLQEASTGFDLKRNAIDLKNPVNNCGGTGGEDSANKSLWTIFVLGFLGGLVGLIMPCTFPMIPLTVSFFTKRAATKKQGITNAFLYGFFIFLIYVLLSVPFYFLDAGNSDVLNNISTNAWLNIVFALIFLVFAISFFGAFEITLPSRFTNNVDAKSNVGSVGGIFFMALTLAIVSFSCTGPILGSLLVGALNQDGGALQLTMAMAGFGLALGLPFALFALFPNWLSSLPKSGSWMNTVKIVFGFVELALALKYLSNADLVEHWGLLKREVFIGIWLLISLATSLYLFGILKFSYDPPPAKLSAGRKIFAGLFLLLAIYLAPGLTNTKYANLSLVSGFPPPLTYSIYQHEADNEKGVEAQVLNDYEAALALAKKENKPILIDFTGWACVNCRKMEENVWPNPQIKKLIKENYILVSLYVDDRKKLLPTEQFIYTLPDGSKKEIKTVGNKFSTLQSVNFSNASQPLYVAITANEKLLTLPVGYTPNVNEYAAWLQCGIDAFNKIK